MGFSKIWRASGRREGPSAWTLPRDATPCWLARPKDTMQVEGREATVQCWDTERYPVDPTHFVLSLRGPRVPSVVCRWPSCVLHSQPTPQQRVGSI